jgi:hypothetical protein
VIHPLFQFLRKEIVLWICSIVPGQFILFSENLDFLKNFQKYFFLKEIKGPDRIFENMPFVEIGSPKIN